MSDLVLWGAFSASIILGVASWWLPEWVSDRLKARKQRQADAEAADWAETPHNEVLCDECGSISCLDCPGQGNRHDSTCQHYHEAL